MIVGPVLGRVSAQGGREAVTAIRRAAMGDCGQGDSAIMARVGRQ